MRRIPVISYPDGGTSMVLYQNALSIPKTGDYAELTTVVPILRKVADANGALVLNEEEWMELCDRLGKVKFQHLSVIAYDAIEAALHAEEFNA